jgi:hypothetical protein
MSYYLVADLDSGKYEIYKIPSDDEFYYDDFVEFLKEETKHNIVGAIQNDPLTNESISNVKEKDFVFFEGFLQEFHASRMKKSKP